MRLAAAAATLLLLLVAFAGSVRAAGPEAFPTYYLQPWPEKVESYLQLMDEQDAANVQKSYGSVVGFMAELFRQHPEKTQQWLGSLRFSRNTQTALVHALWMAGRQDDAKSAALAYQWSEQQISALESAIRRIPDISALSPDTGNELDMLWGAFFASGNKAYVERILLAYHARASNPNIDTKDIFLVARTMGARLKHPAAVDEIKNLRKRYPDDQAAQALILAATALWALGANARQYERVLEIVLGHLATVSDMPGAGALGAYTAQASVAVAGSAQERAILTTTSDQRMFDAMGAAQFVPADVFKNYRKTFGKNDPGYVAILIFTSAKESMDYSVRIKGPGSVLINHPAAKVVGPKEPGRASIQRVVVPFKAPTDAPPGIYQVSARFRPSGRPQFELKTLAYVDPERTFP
jgi:hypothetical protein